HRVLYAARGIHAVTVRFQQGLHELATVWMVLDEQNLSRHSPARDLDSRLDRRERGLRKHQSNRRPDSRRRLDLGAATMSLHDAVHLGQAQARTHLSLRREER